MQPDTVCVLLLGSTGCPPGSLQQAAAPAGATGAAVQRGAAVWLRAVQEAAGGRGRQQAADGATQARRGGVCGHAVHAGAPPTLHRAVTLRSAVPYHGRA